MLLLHQTECRSLLGKQVRQAHSTANIDGRKKANHKAGKPHNRSEGKNKRVVSRAGTHDPGSAMQARLLERPQQVNSINSKANKADPPKNPATTRPNTKAPIDRVCRETIG